MTDLSPAANAVLDAYMANCGWLDGPLEKDYRCAAAVLRAILVGGIRTSGGDVILDGSFVLAIAAELEAQS